MVWIPFRGCPRFLGTWWEYKDLRRSLRPARIAVLSARSSGRSSTLCVSLRSVTSSARLEAIVSGLFAARNSLKCRPWACRAGRTLPM